MWRNIIFVPMSTVYNLAIAAISALFRVAALFHPKAKAFVNGRRGLLSQIEKTFAGKNIPAIWMHCASVGEFEQGRPVLEAMRKQFPGYKLVLTFFSPSAYELRKNYSGADYIYYLPWDTKSNARRFLQAINPTLVIFVKYEFWYHYSRMVREKNIPLISISSIFRPQQLFFKSYGSFYRGILRNFSYFFVQNDQSLKLLRSIGIENAARAGDTRFDRVAQIVNNTDDIPIASAFKGSEKLMVVGSCWQEDFDVLMPLISEQRLKFIIAPHEISESFISGIEKAFQGRAIRYSQAQGKNLEDFFVLIIDNVGLLSRLYRYGEFAYIGGAFGKGLHNILEAACYGVPVFFGNQNYEKFQEAVDLINLGGAFEVANYTDLKRKYEMLNVPENFVLACEVTRQYVHDNIGATEKILVYCRKVLKP
jgi:3-deoxy-D-manno-octulosonic-acid transferase